MKIGEIDLDTDILLVAEIGNNHEGNFDLAAELIELASESGATGVKFQITNPEFTTIINNSGDNIFKERDYFGNVKIRKLHIQVLNKYGEVVELNGSELSLALEYIQNYNSKNQLKINSILNNDRQ